jgi:solute:Na+ symporter, SSS family
MASAHFAGLDWIIIAAYFAFLTWIGFRVSGRQDSAQEYFLASRSLPWYAVSASIVATAISGVTFIGVPALVFAQGGDFRYLQFSLAGLIAKWILGQWILPRLYEKNYTSPYEFIRARLGPAFGTISTLLFFIGAVLGQGVRVFAVALVLELLTGLSMAWCVVVIVGFSTLHTWLGGIRAVVWTDVVQFFVFIAGGLLAVAFVSELLPGGFSTLVESGQAAGKTRVLDFTADPLLSFTFWTGVVAMPFQYLAAFGTDQLHTQRMLCCRSIGQARLALYTSNVGELVVVVFLFVGLALWSFYQLQPLEPSLAALVQAAADRIFPVFIITELPAGLRGLLVAGVFAAAMSSLDSLLAALSQTTLSMFHRGYRDGSLGDARAVMLSRLLVAAWGVVLGAFAVSLAGTDRGLVPLAFAMTAYTYGPMLGLLLLALWVPRERITSAPLGVGVSLLGVFLVHNARMLGFTAERELVAFPWLFPLGVSLCVVFALLPWRRAPTLSPGAA